jgi:hypothetical protein
MQEIEMQPTRKGNDDDSSSSPTQPVKSGGLLSAVTEFNMYPVQVMNEKPNGLLKPC